MVFGTEEIKISGADLCGCHEGIIQVLGYRF